MSAKKSHIQFHLVLGEALSNSYNIQYIALILIILTFILGAFISPRVKAGRQGALPVQVAAAARQAPPSIGKMALNDLFQAASTDLNQTEIYALTKFLTNHDVDADFEIGAGLTDNDSQGLQLALARGIRLRNALQKQGVPVEAFRVFARSAANFQGSVEFRKTAQGFLKD